MANQEHLDILAKGVEAWNAWCRAKGRVVPDLSRAYLSGAHLSGADLFNVDLSSADLVRANLDGAYLDGANLKGAYLSRAYLSRAHLSGADLSGADLSRADLRGAYLSRAYLSRADLVRANLDGASLDGTNLNGANLSGANLNGANLSRAYVLSTVFADLDLGNVRGLDSVWHRGPSTIGLDTIYRSKGKIPESFLRGAGVPENFITYMRSLTGEALEFYSCFISYSTKDQDFADRLYADLQARGVRCWFAPHDIQSGKKIHEQLEEAIRLYEKLLLILSDASMNSPWVKTEIANARAREQQQNRQMLFPITLVAFERIKAWKLFDADTGIDSAREIREYYVPDFSNWKSHESYTAVFERLVRDLKAQPGEKAVAQPAP
jgi:hypothetical protein